MAKGPHFGIHALDMCFGPVASPFVASEDGINVACGIND